MLRADPSPSTPTATNLPSCLRSKVRDNTPKCGFAPPLCERHGPRSTGYSKTSTASQASPPPSLAGCSVRTSPRP
jgi:hypothetical protein